LESRRTIFESERQFEISLCLKDDDTRFWIAQQVADTKNVADLKPLFKNAKELTGKRPSTLTSDGAPNFNDAF
jgi:putative transposase